MNRTRSILLHLLLAGAAARRSQCRHLVLLKSPYAGSTWFTDELTKLGGVRMIAQLYASKDAHVAADAVARRMTDVLQGPCAARRGVAGFTQNPAHAVLANLTNFDWRFLRDADDVFIATWTRGNLVHRTFSQLSFDHGCREHNVRSPSARAACAGATYAVGRAELLRELWISACERAHILALGDALAQPGRAEGLSYEDFVRDGDAVLRGLFRFLDLPTDDIAARRHSAILKRSAENVSSMLANAEDVVGWLRGWSGAGAPLVDMLLDVSGSRFDDADPRRLCDRLDSLQRREGDRDDATRDRFRALGAQLRAAGS